MTAHVRKHLPVQELVDRLGREEQQLKRCGAFGEAAGVRDSIVVVLRMADEVEPQWLPMEPGADA